MVVRTLTLGILQVNYATATRLSGDVLRLRKNTPRPKHHLKWFSFSDINTVGTSHVSRYICVYKRKAPEILDDEGRIHLSDGWIFPNHFQVWPSDLIRAATDTVAVFKLCPV